MSPESQENVEGSDRTELERHSAAPLWPLVGHKTEERAATDPALDSSDSAEACSSSGAVDGNIQSRGSPGVNGQHRTLAPYVSDYLHVSSESEGETGVTSENKRPQREKGLAQSALKRTHVGSEEVEKGSSPSEKKLKT